MFGIGLRRSLLGLDVPLAACGLAGFVLSTMTVAVRWRLLMKVLDILQTACEPVAVKDVSGGDSGG